MKFDLNDYELCTSLQKLWDQCQYLNNWAPTPPLTLIYLSITMRDKDIVHNGELLLLLNETRKEAAWPSGWGAGLAIWWPQV